MRHFFSMLISARPLFELFVGLSAIAFGVGLSVVVVAGGGSAVEALLALVIGLYGVVHIVVRTDVRRRLRGARGHHRG